MKRFTVSRPATLPMILTATLAIVLGHAAPAPAADLRAAAAAQTRVRRVVAPTPIAPATAPAAKAAPTAARTGAADAQPMRRLERQPAPGTAVGLAPAKTPALAMGVASHKLTAITTKAGEFDTTLEVRTIGSDVITTWGISHAISAPQPLTFRWATQVASPVSAVRRITGLTSNGSPVTLQETAVALPQGAYSIFSYPFPSGFDSFIVQIVVTDQANQEISSVPVHISYGPPSGPTPTISLPKLVFTISKIVMIDDSDDLSTGEVDFCFWAEYSGTATKVTEYYNGDFDSGTSANPGVQVVVDGTPSSVTLRVKGRDDDTSGGFTSPGCGGSTSEYDFAYGSRHVTLPIAAISTPAHSFSSFKATGSEDLEFEVRGTWQVIP